MQRLESDAWRTCRARRRRCKLCCFELCERKVQGYRMPVFLQMLGGVAMPTPFKQTPAAGNISSASTSTNDLAIAPMHRCVADAR